MDETFQALFPGALAENLVELILNQNALTSVPLGLRDLSRLRSLDLSHNQLEFLPEPDVWDCRVVCNVTRGSHHQDT